MIRTKLPLAANGQSSSASSKAHAFGLHGARCIGFDVLTRKRHCSTPSASCQTLVGLVLSFAEMSRFSQQPRWTATSCMQHVINSDSTKQGIVEAC